MGQLEKSMEQFVRLQAVLRHQPEVLFQLASIHEELGNDELSIEWSVSDSPFTQLSISLS